MSHQAVNWARHEAPMLRTAKGKPDTTAREILGELAEHADEHGANSYPSVLHISWATGYDERTVQRALRRLECAGLITRHGMYRGCVRWKLTMSMVRPESDWTDLEAAAEKTKRLESERRAARRERAATPLSGTQDAGQIEVGESPLDAVRHAESRRPARRIPASGTQNPGVRHSTPPEPSVEPPENLPRTSSGGTLPPDPLRTEDPPSSGSSEREEISFYEHRDQDRDVIANHRPRAREDDAAEPVPLPWRLPGAVIEQLRLAGAIHPDELPEVPQDREAVILPFRRRRSA